MRLSALFLALAMAAGIAVQAYADSGDLRDRTGRPICTHGDC